MAPPVEVQEGGFYVTDGCVCGVFKKNGVSCQCVNLTTLQGNVSIPIGEHQPPDLRPAEPDEIRAVVSERRQQLGRLGNSYGETSPTGRVVSKALSLK